MKKFCIIPLAGALAALLLSAATAIASTPPTFTTLTTFSDYDGVGSVVQGADGNLYGPACQANNFDGAIDKVTLEGAVAPFYNFCSEPDCSDGICPEGLLLASDGNFYGVTTYAGTYHYGTFFKLTPEGALTTLYGFTGAQGQPTGGLVQVSGGDFVGTTGATVFRITSAGVLTTLHSFCSQPNCADGEDPSGALLQAQNGNVYGETWQGGQGDCVFGCGTIYQITPAGAFTVFHSFAITDGASPRGGLTHGSDGNLYGTTEGGGAYSSGTVFKITTEGALTTLYSFGADINSHVGGPTCRLVEASNGKFYGTTHGVDDGEFGGGTIFEITSNGALTNLYSFDEGTQGTPFWGLLQDTNGTFYGATPAILYSLSVGLPPFIKPVPDSGHVGSPVTILGTNLTGAYSVSFNGTPAPFTVVSATEITTRVPFGATTGAIEIATPGGTLSRGFFVTP